MTVLYSLFKRKVVIILNGILSKVTLNKKIKMYYFLLIHFVEYIFYLCMCNKLIFINVC